MTYSIRNTRNIPSMPERVLSALAYFTCGILGIILLIASYLLKTSLKPFMKFNVYQSILLGFIFGFVQLTYSIVDGVFQLLQIIPFLGKFLYSIFNFIVYYLMSFPILFGFSLLSSLVIILILYLAVLSFQGKTPYIPYLSDAIQRFI